MNSVRHQFLASAGFAFNEYGGISRRHHSDSFEDFLEPRAFPDHVCDILVGPDFVLQRVGDGLPDRIQQVLSSKGLVKKFAAPALTARTAMGMSPCPVTN